MTVEDDCLRCAIGHGGLMHSNYSISKNIIVFFALIFFAFGTSSCSWMSKRKTLIEDKNNTTTAENVPKKKYNDLMDKYEDLLRKYNDQQVKMGRSQESKQLMKDLGAKPGIGLAETVDVFGNDGIANQAKSSTPIVVDSGNEFALPISDKKLEQEVVQLNEAIEHLRNNQFDKGMVIFKKLEKSQSNQIRVRAKYFIGDLLFIQKEYDLAMQIFEDLIKKYAFSGITLKALGRLIVCSQQLKIKEKEERYYSILHDFFGKQ